MPTMLLFAAIALAETERLTWTVTYMGMAAGTAWAEHTRTGDAQTVVAGCTSAPWLAKLYPVDDRARSTWVTARGSTYYETRFREGTFQEDAEVHFGDSIRSTVRMFKAGAWNTVERTFAPVPLVLDPVAAFYATREGVERMKVWTGRWGTDVVLRPAGTELLDGTLALKVEVISEHKGGDIESRGMLWYTADADRVPIRLEFHTRVGPVLATLSERVVTP